MMDSTFYDPFDCEITCEEFYGDEPDPDDLDDSVEIIPDDWDADIDGDLIPEPGFLGDDEDDLFDAAGGLTAEAYTLLGEMDRQGFFV